MGNKKKQVAVANDWESGILSASTRYAHIGKQFDLKWAQEKFFALALVRQGTDELRACTPESLGDAVLQAAAAGLTLNPTLGYCYLVPYKNQYNNYALEAKATPSYKGLINSAIESGAVLWAVADVIRANDGFKFKGPHEKAEHDVNVFADRGDIVGAYTVAKTTSGDYLSSFITIIDINQARDQSKAKNSLMWSKFFDEACKKVALRKAYKQWPKKTGSLTALIDLYDNSEGIDFQAEKEIEGETIREEDYLTDEHIQEINQVIIDSGINNDNALKVLRKICKAYGSDDFTKVRDRFFDEIVPRVKAACDAYKKTEEATSGAGQ